MVVAWDRIDWLVAAARRPWAASPAAYLGVAGRAPAAAAGAARRDRRDRRRRDHQDRLVQLTAGPTWTAVGCAPRALVRPPARAPAAGDPSRGPARSPCRGPAPRSPGPARSAACSGAGHHGLDELPDVVVVEIGRELQAGRSRAGHALALHRGDADRGPPGRPAPRLRRADRHGAAHRARAGAGPLPRREREGDPAGAARPGTAHGRT